MDQIEMLIEMQASVLGDNPPLVLPPIRPNMFVGFSPQGQNRATGFEINQFQFGGTIPHAHAPPPPQATNLPNVVPNEPPDDGTMIGTAPQVSLFFVSIIIVFFVLCRNRNIRQIGQPMQRKKMHWYKVSE